MPTWLPALLVGFASVLVQLYVGVSSRARLEGELGAKVLQHGKDIETIQGEQVRQWESITGHEGRIAHIEGAHASKRATSHPI